MKGRGKEIALGLLLLVAAGLIIAAQMGFQFIFAGFSWFEIIVLIACIWAFVTGLVEMEFYKLLFGLGIGYVVVCGEMGWPEVNVWVMLLAVGVAGSGLNMIFRRRKSINVHIGDDDTEYYHYSSGDKTVYSESDREGEDAPRNHRHSSSQEVIFSHKTVYTGDAEYIGGDMVFSGVNKYIEGQNIRGVSADVVFSSLRLYFDKAQLNDDVAEVRMDVVFSSVYIYVPRDWNVVDETGRIFGRPSTDYAEVIKSGAPTLYIKGDCVFGNIIVKRV